MRSYGNAEREPDKPGAGLFKNVVNTGQSISGRLAAHYLGRVFGCHLIQALQVLSASSAIVDFV